jgi:hypothetical protein
VVGGCGLDDVASKWVLLLLLLKPLPWGGDGGCGCGKGDMARRWVTW